MRGSPFRRRGPDHIEVRSPQLVGPAIEWAAGYVGRTVTSPETVGFGRLFPSIEAGAEDDPLVTLERQTVLDSLLATVMSSTGAASLTEAQAEAWLQILSLALALHMEDHGIRTEGDRERLAPADAALIDAIYMLQMCLIEVIDETP